MRRVHPGRGIHRPSLLSFLDVDKLHNFLALPAQRAIWSDDAVIQTFLDYEAALALAQKECDVIPAQAADTIARVCQDLQVDPQQLATEARLAGTLAIPLMKQLKAAVTKVDPEAAAYVHYGSTSQDMADTAVTVLAQTSLRALRQDLLKLGQALVERIETTRHTPLLGRTLIQPAAPVTFGWKLAGWLDALTRNCANLLQAGQEAAVLQFGGANGTLATHYGRGQQVAQALAARLGLQAPAISWHGQRDRLARLACELALLTGSLGKWGRDISLLMQIEVAEAFEPTGNGRGGSSAMPHKRNPVSSMFLMDGAYRAPALAQTLMAELASEHERGLGNWANNLPILADLFALAGSSVTAALDIATAARIDEAAMQRNIDALYGVVFSEGISLRLSALLGPKTAAEIVGAVCQTALSTQTPIVELLKQHAQVTAVLSQADIEQLAGLDTQIAACQPMCSAVILQWEHHLATFQTQEN